MKSYKNILLINFGGIGDEILFSPVINNLRKNFPSAKLTLCLEGRSKAFINLTDCLDDYFCVNIKTKNKYLEMLKLYFKALFGNYDLVISSGANPLISVLLFFSFIKTRVGYAVNPLSKLLLSYPVILNKNQYASQMYFDLVKSVTDDDFELPKIKVPPKSKIKNSVLVHPGVSAISVSKNITKTIKPQDWAELIKKLIIKGKNVYLAGGPDDADCISQIRSILTADNITSYIDMYGKTKNIYELAELISASEVLLCSDSAPMHIGVATNTKTIAIFGPTNEKLLLPVSDNFIPITNASSCRPCLWNVRTETCGKLDCLIFDYDKIVSLIP